MERDQGAQRQPLVSAGIADEQARLVGALQHPLVAGDRITVAWLPAALAPMYEQLGASLPGG